MTYDQTIQIIISMIIFYYEKWLFLVRLQIAQVLSGLLRLARPSSKLERATTKEGSR